MYVITFYSFKGGVGRTMALVNVAAELVRRGRTVLVVDFDLEAPGLETYKHLEPPKGQRGIVEYVTEFRNKSYQVPNLLEYVYETKPIGKKGGRLWVMPAGDRRDRAYRVALSNLNWQELYTKEDGFLLFEDTKKGWEIEFKPDYVLIDSRTGDTDVLGICTRQLPDSVVLMFTPNEQNLVGLKNVCKDIRREETEGLKKKIQLHFVAANVPDLDDDKRILCRQVDAFQKRLDFKALSGRILRYDSLELLDQRIFTLDRPRTRLARSYRRLVRTLIKDNLADREGAKAFLRDWPNDPNDISAKDYMNRLDEIARRFESDADVLFQISECFISWENHRAAKEVLDSAIRAKPGFTSAISRRAECSRILGQIDKANEDLRRLRDQTSPFCPSSEAQCGDFLRAVEGAQSLSADDEKKLAYQIEDGNSEARDHLVRANLRSVVEIAQRYEGKDVPLIQLFQFGTLGLLRAVESFDPSGSARFADHAHYWIENAIEQELAAKLSAKHE